MQRVPQGPRQGPQTFIRLDRSARPLSALPTPATRNVADATVDKGRKKLDRAGRQQIYSDSTLSQRDLPRLTIEGIVFRLYDPEVIRKESVIKVTSVQSTGFGSVNDSRMGVVTQDEVCTTCQSIVWTCPGHPGHIELEEPVIHPHKDVVRTVVSVLKSVCNSCSGLLLTREDILQIGMDQAPIDRIRLIEKASENLPCRNARDANCPVRSCPTNPKYIPPKPNEVAITYTIKKKVHTREVRDILDIFSRISPEDAELLGFMNGSHPRFMIIQALPVDPPRARPPGMQEDGVQKPNDITEHLIHIVSYNEQLKTETSAEKRIKLISNLTQAIRTMMQGSDSGYRGAMKRQEMNRKTKINDKQQGVIRAIIHGKTSMYSGRAVIVPAPDIKFGQILIPEAMAEILTKTDTVTVHNQENLQKMLRDGKIKIITPISGDNKGQASVVQDHHRQQYQLKIGDTVERWLQNGDYVLVNRQPTLSKWSMMGSEVVIWDQLVIGLHMAETSPRNADFDGDEINIHVMQGPEAERELATTVNVKSCIMGAQDNRVEIGVVYEGLLASYLMTQPDVVIPAHRFYNYVAFLSNTDVAISSKVPRDPNDPHTLFERAERHGIYKPPRYPEGTPDNERHPVFGPNGQEAVLTGRLLFSATLPPDFSYKKEDVVIVDGILVSGVIKKNHIGLENDTIQQAILLQYGDNERVATFITDAYWVLQAWLTDRNTSVGIGDCISPDPKLKSRVMTISREGSAQIRDLGEPLSNPLDEERREKRINEILRETQGKIGVAVRETLPMSNSFRLMIESGAKGKIEDVVSITNYGGQKYSRGARMPLTIDNRTRSLPYFAHGDLNPQARGLCTHSYVEGLTPAEFIFQQAGSRDDLVTMAASTPDVGAMSHQMVRVMENLMVYDDHTVRDSTGNIIQFVYGGDGLDSERMTKVNIGGQVINTFINIARLVDNLNAQYGYSDVSAISEAQVPQFVENIDAMPEYIEQEYGDD